MRRTKSQRTKMERYDLVVLVISATFLIVMVGFMAWVLILWVVTEWSLGNPWPAVITTSVTTAILTIVLYVRGGSDD